MGKGTISARDLLGGFPDTREITSGFYGIPNYVCSLGWWVKREDVECDCSMCEKDKKK